MWARVCRGRAFGELSHSSNHSMYPITEVSQKAISSVFSFTFELDYGLKSNSSFFLCRSRRGRSQ